MRVLIGGVVVAADAIAGIGSYIAVGHQHGHVTGAQLALFAAIAAVSLLVFWWGLSGGKSSPAPVQQAPRRYGSLR